MERLFRKLAAVLEWWSVLLLVLMVALVCVGVFFRYILNASLAWYDEFASYLLVWLTFYGAVVASQRRRHIGFFQAVLLFYGWELVQKMGEDRTVSLPWVKMGWIYSALPIAGCLMLLISMARLIDIAFARERRIGDEVAWTGSSSE
jgi:TRAP-type C4-dicarboxylate transport system permease small subunit